MPAACARPSRSSPRGSSGSTGRVPGAARRPPGVRRAAAPARSPRWYASTGPEIVITGNFRDTGAAAHLNQADHIAAGQGNLDAYATRATAGSSPQLVDGLEPWGGVPGVGGRLTEPAHGVDITDTFPAGVESLGRTRPTSTGSGGRNSTPRSSSRAFHAAPGTGWAFPRRPVRGVRDRLGRLTPGPVHRRTSSRGDGPVSPAPPKDHKARHRVLSERGRHNVRDMTTTIPHVWRGPGAHSLLMAAGLLGRQLGITAEAARWRLDTDAENLGMSGTDLAELILYREAVVS